MLTRTTTALLDDLADPANDEVWRQIDSRYRPVLTAFAAQLGLSDDDAADAAQETLHRFLTAFRAGRYERGRGRLSSWIIGIARNCVAERKRQTARRREQHGMSAIGEIPGEERQSQMWEAACQREILRRAVEALSAETRFDDRTIEAFELIAFRQLSAAEVAQRLDMTMNDVYLAKHRCLKRLRELVERITVAFETDA
jgi:RNA polymerase sigma factor (sigma-70 family)